MKYFTHLLLLLAFCSQVTFAQSITNPGFETGTLSGWTSWAPAGGGTPFIATSPHTGSYAAKLSGGICSIEQTITGLKPWTQYTLSAWVRIASAGDSATIGVKNFRDTVKAIVRATSTTYTKYSVSFTTGNINTSATIYFVTSDTSVVTAVDDFTIAETMPVSSIKYYIDDVNGNDNNSGNTPALAWQSLAKVNQTVFFPGDSLFFKKGGVWTGTFNLKGEGKTGKPIVVTSYGNGTSRPLFNGNGALRTIYLKNQQYIELCNLEITNSANPGNKKRGIEVENTNRGILYNINIHDNYVHDILGDNTKGQDGSIGIMIVIKKTGNNDTPSWFDTVKIENNIVKTVNRTGIGSSSDWRCNPLWSCTTGAGYYPIQHMVIRNNYVENAGGDGIIPIASYATLLEYNIVNGANVNSGTANAGMWCFAGVKNIFQHNEVYNVKTIIDGEGYDVDFNQDSTIFQYNYSHDNQGGFMLLCTNVVGANTNAVVRYNISQNDKARLIMINGAVQDAKIYNNTMYLPSGSTTSPIVIDDWGGTFPSNIYFKNNIFHLTSAGPWVDWSQITGYKSFDYNIVYGAHTAGEPTGTGNLSTDPKLVSPGSGTTGGLISGVLTFGNVDGYKLQTGSPAIGSGSLVVTGSGGLDYWGNAVSNPPNIGAYNGTPVTPPAPLSGPLSIAVSAADNGIPDANRQLSCYPNPLTNSSLLSYGFQSSKEEMTNVYIRNAAGKNIYGNRIRMNKGMNRSAIHLPALAAGNYFLVVVDGDQVPHTVQFLVTGK